MLELQEINKVFNAGTVDEASIFTDFNFKIDKGQFVSVIGSNGSGKTTLLNLICGSLMPEKGKIIFDDKDITRQSEFVRAKKIGRVFQDPKMGTCSGLTILENMALADNKNKGFGFGFAVNKKRIDKYKTLLETCHMGLENRLNTAVGSLSGGQRQALALVIANMSNINLLILDEHTAALDPKAAETIMELTDEFVKSKGITALMVTHNLKFAIKYGNRLVMMHKGNCIIDVKDKEKENYNIQMLLDKFNEISIEMGN